MTEGKNGLSGDFPVGELPVGEDASNQSEEVGFSQSEIGGFPATNDTSMGDLKIDSAQEEGELSYQDTDDTSITTQEYSPSSSEEEMSTQGAVEENEIPVPSLVENDAAQTQVAESPQTDHWEAQPEQVETQTQWEAPSADYSGAGEWPVVDGYGERPDSPLAGNFIHDNGAHTPPPQQPYYGAPPPPSSSVEPGNQPPVSYPGYYGYYGAPPPRRPKSAALKVFLWILSVLSVGTIAGFAVYAGYVYTPNDGQMQAQEMPPWYEQYEQLPPEMEEDIPDYDDGVEAPDPQKETPQIDMTANPQEIVITQQPVGSTYLARVIYEKVAPSTVTVSSSVADMYGEENTTTGTGIIVTTDGYIITNSHVVFNSKSTAVQITTYDGQVYDAVVVGADRTTDLAVLKTNDHKFTPAEFGDINEMVIGDEVIAIGNPGGEQFSSSLTKGVISGLDRIVGNYSENGMTYIQTDAAINPGNSGGPLVNMYGQVIGINSSKIVSAGYEGMGFAIPVSKARDIINELSIGGYVKGRTRLGIKGRDVTAMEAQYYGVPIGFMIQEIDEDSGFYGTEAQPYDIITAIEGEEVTGIESIANLLLSHNPGDEIKVTLHRVPENGTGEGEEIEITVLLLEDMGETQN